MAATVSGDTVCPEEGDVTGCTNGSGEVRVNGEVKSSDAIPEKTKEIGGIMGKMLDTDCDNMNEEDKTSKASLSNGASIDSISSDGDSDVAKNDCQTKEDSDAEEKGRDVYDVEVKSNEDEVKEVSDDEKMDMDELEESLGEDEKKSDKIDSTVNSAKTDNHLGNNSEVALESKSKEVSGKDSVKPMDISQAEEESDIHMDISQAEDESDIMEKEVESELSVQSVEEEKGGLLEDVNNESNNEVSKEGAHEEKNEKPENQDSKDVDTVSLEAEENEGKKDGKSENSDCKDSSDTVKKVEDKGIEQTEDKDIEIVVEKSTPPQKSSGQGKNMSELERHLRRSTRKCTRNRKYEDPEIEELEPVDPLADADPLADPLGDPLAGKDPLYSKPLEKSTIVVKDTKVLSQLVNERKNTKKEPTLVIIDTNSILSGRGPVPVSTVTTTASQQPTRGPYPGLPAAVPAQGMYPATQTSNYMYPQQSGQKQAQIQIYNQQSNLVDPNFTDDTYIVEAPSFIVPYVYEKPPKEAIKAYIEKINKENEEELQKKREEEQRKKEEEEQEKKKKEEEEQEKKKKEEEVQEKKKKEEEEQEKKKKEEEEQQEKEKRKEKEQKEKKKRKEEEQNQMEEKEQKMEEERDKEEKEGEELEENVEQADSTSNRKEEKEVIKEQNDEKEQQQLEVKSNEEKSTETKEKDEGKKKEEDDSKGKEDKGDEKKDDALNKKEGKANTEENKEKDTNSEGPPKEIKKIDEFFDCTLGKMLTGIGMNLVQEYVQTDLLRSQKRKADREGGRGSAETQHAIHSLLKNLEDSKENNEPFHFEQKKCEFCSFKTESSVVMAHHLETPHMRNYLYRCNFCSFETRSPQVILFHMEAEHNVRGRLERAPFFHQCPSCPFEDNSKAKLNRHMVSCQKKFKLEKNQDPPSDWDPPAKIPKPTPARGRPNILGQNYAPIKTQPPHPLLPKPATTASLTVAQPNAPGAMGQNRPRGRPVGSYKPSDTRVQQVQQQQQPGKPLVPSQIRQGFTPVTGMFYRPTGTVAQPQVYIPTAYQMSGNQIYQVVSNQGQVVPMIGGNFNNVPRFTIIPTSNASSTVQSSNPTPVALVPNLASSLGSITIQSANTRQAQPKMPQQPSISITPLPRQAAAAQATPTAALGLRPGQPTNQKATFVICEICDGYIKDLEQLRNHMQWIHKVKIHPKMIYNRPPLNCQKCQFRFFTDQGLERHLLGTHGLVTSSMQEAANKGQDSGRCPVCGKVYQWKLLNHVAKDHNMTLKPAHLSYKCTVCTATFGMYKLFENHVYSAHSMVAKRVMDHKKPGETQLQKQSPQLSQQTQSILRPLKINDEITIIPQPSKVIPVSSRSSSVTIHQVNRKLQCEVCGFLFDRAYFPQFVSHYQRKHLKKCSVNLCKFDKCPTCEKKYMTENLSKYLENRKIEHIDVIEITDDEVIIAGKKKNEITITKVNQSSKRFKEAGGNSGSKKTIEIIDLDSPVKKPSLKAYKPCPKSRRSAYFPADIDDEKETSTVEDSSLAAVKARLRRRKSLEISSVKSAPRTDDSEHSSNKNVRKQERPFSKPCPKSRRPAALREARNDDIKTKDSNSIKEESEGEEEGEVKKNVVKSLRKSNREVDVEEEHQKEEEVTEEEEAEKNDAEGEEMEKNDNEEVEAEKNDNEEEEAEKNDTEEEEAEKNDSEEEEAEKNDIEEEETEKNDTEEEEIKKNDSEEEEIKKNDSEEEEAEKNDTEEDGVTEEEGEVNEIEEDGVTEEEGEKYEIEEEKGTEKEDEKDDTEEEGNQGELESKECNEVEDKILKRKRENAEIGGRKKFRAGDHKIVGGK